MDLIFSFISRMISAFFIAYIIYLIAARRPKVPIIVLGIWTLFSLIEWLGVARLGLEPARLVVTFLLRVMPNVAALVIFAYATGALRLGSRVRRARMPRISTDVSTLYKDRLWLFSAITGGLVSALTGYLFIEGFMRMVILVVSLLVVFVSLWRLWVIARIKEEKVIVFVGRQKDRIYAYDIASGTFKVTIRDFFTNQDYIVDPIGEALIEEGPRVFARHHLYWIATGDAIDMTTQPLQPHASLSYQDHLDTFEKYHYKLVTFKVVGTGRAELVKSITIR
ncbi:MAG: hypothetical protein EA375_01460 [Acholeplasmataceae bacterium]|nr:MAG: hypothetical protein EA375_01460 [Acholeplasmataceae bacterium]